MPSKRKYNFNSETLLFIVGSLLLIISFLLFHYDKIVEVCNNLRAQVDHQLYLEQTKNNITVNVNVNYLEEDTINN